MAGKDIAMEELNDYVVETLISKLEDVPFRELAIFNYAMEWTI